jgi:FkbH-like protein
MYETEVNSTVELSNQIPPAALSRFTELRDKIVARTLIPWGEHCTECGWPTCYSTCDLYAPREDLRCRRFVEGMVRVDCARSVNSYLLKIKFKRWGKLWARGNFRLYAASRAERAERRDYWIGTTLQRLPLPSSTKRALTEKRYGFKKRLASRGSSGGQRPTSFLLECYNPKTETVQLSVTIRSLFSPHPVPFPNLVQLAPGFRRARELKESKIPFQKLIDVAPGFHRARIPFEDIAAAVDLGSPFSIDITPNEAEDGTTLYFGALDFVQEAVSVEPAGKPVKCVVWDLDNTLWEGILVEDGLTNLRLKRGIPEVIKELDQRGILHSIASKNNLEEAIQALRKFGLEEYFLCPQISWGPKSEGVRAIAKELNIGLDTLLFVDDSEFELQEVRAACPGVSVLNASEYLALPDRGECRPPLSEQSGSRRLMYQVEKRRRALAESFGDDYLAFLRQCEIKVEIRPLADGNLDRVHELTQRTNQMNFSGNRYDRDLLKQIMASPHLDTFVIACEDRFGSYGVVGFSIVDRREPRMTDLMFSCRIQSKRVEHAFLAFLARKYVSELNRDFLANYRRTERNAPSGRVFADLGMREVGIQAGVSEWVCLKNSVPADEGICEIRVADSMVAAEALS